MAAAYEKTKGNYKQMKTVTVKDWVDRFSLEVLAGGIEMDRVIVKSRAHRPGLNSSE